jgi:hypothetical protein
MAHERWSVGESSHAQCPGCLHNERRWAYVVKRTYGVIGSGDGISGLFACVLLASKGMKCLWVDTAQQKPGSMLWADTPFILTETFFRNLLEPVLSRIDRHMKNSLETQEGLIMQFMGLDEALPTDPGQIKRDHARIQKLNGKYLALLKKSLSKPQLYLRELRSSTATSGKWEDVIGSALSTPEAGRIAQMKAYVSTLGMSAMELGKIKAAFKAFLQKNMGEYREDPGAELVMSGKEVLGLRLNEGIYKGDCYLTEDAAGQGPYHGFYFYGQCRARLGMIPKGVGDLLVISPPEDLKYPVLIKINRDPHNPTLTVQTKINLEPGLTSFTEIISWASGMITKRLSRIMPFLSGPLQAFEVVNPLSYETIRPWFRFSEDVKPPSLFGWRHYITPIEGIYACDRDKYACLGNEGDFFWGICIANTVLKKVGRSDLITVKHV